jgi:regulator of protease activity HflC (stomatin/prohibitin superfamily)
MSIVTMVLLGVGALFLLLTLFSAVVFVPEKKVSLITLFGQYSKTARTSPSFKVPFFGGVAAEIPLYVQQIEVDKAESITKDKVTAHPKIVVQYEVIPGKEREAHYNIGDLSAFITSYVVDVIRSTVPEMDLDACFQHKEQIGAAVKKELETRLEPNGYRVLSVLVTDIDFDANVKKEMNRINAASRAQVAAQSEANAEKIKKETAAEADAKVMELHGQGIAKQRQAIIGGLQDSVKAFQEAVPGSNAAGAMEMVVLTQYMDMMRDIAGKNAKLILLPSGPSAVGNLRQEIMQGFLTAQESGKLGGEGGEATSTQS